MVIETVLGTKGVPLFVFHVLRKRIVEGSAHELSASFLENEKKSCQDDNVAVNQSRFVKLARIENSTEWKAGFSSLTSHETPFHLENAL